MKKSAALILSIFALLLAASSRADTIELKNGLVLQGKYLGGTSDTLRFQTSDGLQIVEYSQVKSMSVAPAAPAAPTPPPPPAAMPASITLPAGTVLMVQMQDSVSSRSAPGTNFSARLQYDLVVGNVAAVKAGTVLYGQVISASQAGRAFGRSTLDIRLKQMVVNGAPVPIATSSYAQQGESEGKKTVAAAGVGAIIGHNTGGSSGSGAAWGAAAASLKPGQTLTVPPGALVEFSLSSPVTINTAR